jgi:hypothetical protein
MHARIVGLADTDRPRRSLVYVRFDSSAPARGRRHAHALSCHQPGPFSAVAVFSGRCSSNCKDPVKVDAKHYRAEFENDRVRVLRVAYGPSREVMHHPANVAIFLTDEQTQFTIPDGKLRTFRRRPAQSHGRRRASTCRRISATSPSS